MHPFTPSFTPDLLAHQLSVSSQIHFPEEKQDPQPEPRNTLGVNTRRAHRAAGGDDIRIPFPSFWRKKPKKQDHESDPNPGVIGRIARWAGWSQQDQQPDPQPQPKRRGRPPKKPRVVQEQVQVQQVAVAVADADRHVIPKVDDTVHPLPVPEPQQATPTTST